MKQKTARTIPSKPIKSISTNTRGIYNPIVHGKATDIIAYMDSKKKPIDPITGNLVIERQGVKLITDKFNKLLGSLGINTHKLFTRGIEEFVKINHIGGNEARELNYTVNFPLIEYALECGYNVKTSIPDTATAEERKAEKKKHRNTIDDVTKKIKKDLEILQASKMNFTDKVKGKTENFMGMKLIGTASIINGYVYMTFDPVFAQYLVRLPLTQHSSKSRSIDPRRKTAYRLMYAMEIHYFNDNNVRKGVSQYLKVKTLLKSTDLPSIKEVRKQNKDWRERIKDPFEEALAYLNTIDILADYKYCKSHGIDITDEEAENFASFEDWEETLLKHEFKDVPDQSERIKRNTVKIEAKQTAKKNKKPKYKAKQKKG